MRTVDGWRITLSTTSRIFVGTVALRTTPQSERFVPELEDRCVGEIGEVGGESLEKVLDMREGVATGGAAAIRWGGSISLKDVEGRCDFSLRSRADSGMVGKSRMGSLSANFALGGASPKEASRHNRLTKFCLV